MKKISIFFIFCFCLSSTYAQQPLKRVVVYDWKKTTDDKIVVSYSISDAKSDEVYEIDAFFYDKQNVKIPAFSLFEKRNISTIKMQFLYWDFYKDRQDIPDISKVEVIVTKIERLYNQNNNNLIDSIYDQKTPPKEEKIASNSNTKSITKKENNFSIGLQGNLGYPATSDFLTPSFESFDEFSQDLGFYMAYNHIGIEGTYFTHSYNSLLNPNAEPYSEIESYLAYLDIILGKRGFHKRGLALVLSAGGGQYNKRISGDMTNWTLIQENELGFSAKVGIVASLGKSLKFKFTYSYHSILDPNQYLHLGIMIGL
ncbi:MAG: hypothetical protein JZU47_10105 [Prolixibacteraceae bacterium]|nr:hypothetical protein [Prolixibacteraceae bacterium]